MANSYAQTKSLRPRLPALFLILFLAVPGLTSAQQLAAETVVAQLGDQQLRLSDVDAMANQLPDEIRPGVFNDPTRIGNTLQTMLVRRAIVAPLISSPPSWLSLEGIDERARRQVLLVLALEEAVRSQPEPDFVKQANAHFDAHPEEYLSAPSVSVRHVLIGTEDRDTVTAYRLAAELRSQLKAGDITMDEAVSRFSDDPAKNRNQGNYPEIVAGQMQPEFEQASFALEKVGELSQPVKTGFGYHLIRLEGIHPPQAPPREQAVRIKAAQLRGDYIKNGREDYLRELGIDAEQILYERAQASQLENHPEFGDRLKLDIEEEVLRVYKTHYLTQSIPADLSALARDYYLTHREEFKMPRQATVIQVSLDQGDDPIGDFFAASWLYGLVTQPFGTETLTGLRMPGATIRTRAFFEGDIGVGPAATFAFSGAGIGKRSDLLDREGRYLFFVLADRDEGRPQPFAEVAGRLAERLRQQQETRVWNAHVAEFHQLPFEADREAVASLRTRYISGP